MRKLINKKIKDLGLEIAGGGTSGCFYFVDIETDTALNADSVMVSAMTHLMLKQWRKEAEYARIQHAERDGDLTGAEVPKVIILAKSIY